MFTFSEVSGSTSHDHTRSFVGRLREAANYPPPLKPFCIATVLVSMKRWIAIMLFMLLLAAPAAAQDQCADSGLHHLRTVLWHINQYRAAYGLAPLKYDAQLSELAAEHSLFLCRHEVLNHDKFKDRFRRAERRICVENVSRNFQSARDEFIGWNTSPEHDVNLRDPDISRAGLAKKGDYITFFACAEPGDQNDRPRYRQAERTSTKDSARQRIVTESLP